MNHPKQTRNLSLSVAPAMFAMLVFAGAQVGCCGEDFEGFGRGDGEWGENTKTPNAWAEDDGHKGPKHGKKSRKGEASSKTTTPDGGEEGADQPGQGGGGGADNKGGDDGDGGTKWTCAELSFSGGTCKGQVAWKSLAESACDLEGSVLVSYKPGETCDGGALAVTFTCCGQVSDASPGSGDDNAGGEAGSGGGAVGSGGGSDSGGSDSGGSAGGGSSDDGDHDDTSSCP